MIKFLLKFLTGELFRLSIGGGGGGQQQQQPTTQTVQQTNLPAWAQPYSEQLLGQAQALTNVNQHPYQSYEGQRLAGFTPMQQQAFQNISGMQVSPQTGQASGLAGFAGLGSLGAGQNYMSMATDPAAIQAFMSPYQQNVTDWQKQQAILDYGRALPGLGARAAQSGAFGGSRQALVESEAQRNLQNQLAGIQATGTQNAFNAAQQAQQFGAGLGLQGFGQAGQLASTLGQLGQQQYGQQMGINAAQQQAGAQQQALQQQGLTNAYQDFLNQQNYPYQQLAFMSDILHGTPTGGITTAQTYQAAPSMFSQIAGLGLGLGALGKGFGFKKGGEVKKYADGGLSQLAGMDVDLADPTTELGIKSQLAQAQKGEQPAVPLQTLIALQKDIQQLHTPAAQPQTTTVAQDLAQQVLAQSNGVAGLPTDEKMFTAAHGGIVAFDAGGDVEQDMSPETAAYQRAMAGSFASKGIGRLGAGIADLVTLPGQLGYDWAHYNRTGELKPKYATQGWFPISAAQPERESGQEVFFAASGEAARKKREAQQAAQVAAAKAAPGGLPTVAAPQMSIAPEARMGLGQLLPQAAPRTGLTEEATPKTRVPAVSGVSAARASAGKEDQATNMIQQEIAALRKRGEERETQLKEAMGQRPQVLTDEEAQTQARQQRAQALKEAGLPEMSYKDRVAELKQQGEQARKDRDTDRWLAVAQGAFAMAAGKSPYAVQNIAAGLGVSTEQLRTANKEFNKAEEARKDRLALLEEAHRKEVLGDVAAGRELRKESVRRGEDYDKAKMTMLGTLAGKDEAALSRLVSSYESMETRRTLAREGAANRQAMQEQTLAQRQEQQRGRMIDAYNKAVQAEKALLAKSNPLAALDPTSEAKFEQQAIQNVTQRNPAFAELAGVDTSALRVAPQISLPQGVKVTRQ